MRSALVLLSLLWVCPALGTAGAAGVVVAGKAAAAPSALAVAGGLIEASLPGLSRTNLLAPSFANGLLSLQRPEVQGLQMPVALAGRPVPALLDTRRAAVLADRAKAAGVGAAQASKTLASAAPQEASPAAVLERINAVLHDVSPAELEKMPAEELANVSAVVMDGMGGYNAGRKELHAGLEALAKIKTDKLLAARGKPLDKDEPYKAVRDMQTVPVYIRGTSERARLVRPTKEKGVQAKQDLSEPAAVFRHYTTEEGYKKILESKSLANGFLPYIELVLYVARYIYQDLTGVFLTVPEASGRDVGVPSDQKYYVDLHLPKGFPLIQPDPSYPIFLVPLPGRTREWVAEVYRRWMKGEAIRPDQKGMAEGLDRDGGPGPDLHLPIKIVGHGQVK